MSLCQDAALLPDRLDMSLQVLTLSFALTGRKANCQSSHNANINLPKLRCQQAKKELQRGRK